MKPLLALLLALPLAAPAQPPAAPPPDTASAYRHQLGLTASPVLDGFFRNNRSLPLGLLYKRQTAPNRAWRLGVVFSQNYNERYNPQPLTNGAFTTRYSNAAAYVGREMQKPFSRRWIGYAGLDVGIGYGRFRRDEDSERFESINGIDVVLRVRDRREENTYTGFIRPLFGIRYNIFSHLYASAEASFDVELMHFAYSGRGTTMRKDTGVIYTESNGSFKELQLSTTLRPINQITLHYLFK